MVPVRGMLFEAESGRARFLVLPGAEPTIVGRRPPYQPHNVRVADVIMSRTHARFTPDGDAVIIDDAGSTSGIYIDHVQLDRPRLAREGETITFGGQHVRARPFRGASLYELLCGKDGALLDGPGAGALIASVLSALEPLHAAGVVHGNLDWHHVLRDDSGAWITLVDGWTVLDPEGTLSCNPAFVAPEVFQTNRLVPTSDLYSLGLVAFEARFGHRPFDRPDYTVHDHMMSKLFGGAPDWRDARVSQYEQDLYLRLLQLHPHQRPTIARALEIIDELWPRRG